MSSSTKNVKGRASPVKQRTQTANNNTSQVQSQQADPEYVVLDQELLKGLTEKDVEIDHLKTTVVAL
jgi:hypothetical protein